MMIEAINLKTEYLKDPMGIDLKHPRLFWQVSGAKKQTAYQIAYRRNEGERIEADPVHTDTMHGMLPEILKSRDRVEWCVRLTDENGTVGGWSDWASFEMGLLEKEDFKAHWIMGDYEHDPKAEVRYPADCFLTEFSYGKKLKRARLYITACGMYEAKLNGKKVGDRVLAPGSTAFQKRVHYQTYDVTELIRTENRFTIELADGFYASRTGCFGKAKIYGYEPKVIAQLELTAEDGTVETVLTDEKFRWSNDGPTVYADLKDGETIDSRKEASWSGHARECAYEGILCADNNVPVHEKEIFTSLRVIHCPDGQTVLDFGQNIAGYMEFSVCGNAGDKVSMICGEKLDENGNFTIANILLKGDYDTERLQREEFICNGTRQTYRPKFTVMGFQYVLLLNWPEEIKPENFRAVAVYSDMEITGTFDCSEEGVNRIVKNTLWSMKGNFLDVPTDCPTRERAGWTGDAQLFFETGNYLMDQAAFFRKWMQDVEDVQKENGMIYNINPANPKGNALLEWFSVEGGVGWGDAFLMIPYYYWKRYGDDTLIRTHWESMKKCFGFYEKRVGKRNLFSLFKPGYGKYSRYLCACGRDFGEWTEPDDCAPSKAALMFPHAEEGTAYIAYDAGIMAEMAEHLGKNSEKEHYKDLQEPLKEAYNHYFLGDGTFTTNRMAKYVRPCALGLAENEVKKNLLQNIVRLNRERDYKVGTGFLSTPFVMELLTEAGASNDAYRMLTNPEFGWMKQVKEGATTIWENWTNDASLNHYSKGACCNWLFACVCGIGFDGTKNKIRITPHTVPQLTHASLRYHSVYGEVYSGWKREGKKIIYEITVPSNCIAEVILPGKEKCLLEAGEYRLEGMDCEQ